MSQEDEGTNKKLKIALIVLAVIAGGLLVGALVSRRQAMATQAEQQQQIVQLNKQVSDSKSSASQQAADAKNKQISDLEAENAKLKEEAEAEADKPSTPTTETTTPTTTTPTTTTPTTGQ